MSSPSDRGFENNFANFLPLEDDIDKSVLIS
jgi:hypothetical protein